MNHRRALAAFTVAILGSALVAIPSRAIENGSASNTLTVSIPGDKRWVDTGMDVNPGDKLHITATGTVDFSDKQGVTPAGAPRDWKDTLRDFMVPSAGRGALVGQVSNDRAATPFLVGADGTITVLAAGRLYLGVNQDSYFKATGAYEVHIDRTAAPKAAANPANYNFQPLFKVLDANLPYRVTDKPTVGGNEGDLVNFVLVGSQEKVTGAFKAAGWILPDKTNQDAVVSAIISTLNKQAYVTVPMSTLYLFGSGQDYGYAQAEAIKVIGE